MGDKKETDDDIAIGAYRVNHETEDELTVPKARHISARPKKYFAPPYTHRQRETREDDMSLSDNSKQRADDQTCFHLKKLTYDRKMISSSRFATPRSPRITMLSKSPSRTDITRVDTTKYKDILSRPLSKGYLEELDREPPDALAEVFHKRHDGFIKVLKSCRRDNKLIPVLFSILAKITKAKV